MRIICLFLLINRGDRGSFNDQCFFSFFTLKMKKSTRRRKKSKRGNKSKRRTIKRQKTRRLVGSGVIFEKELPVEVELEIIKNLGNLELYKLSQNAEIMKNPDYAAAISKRLYFSNCGSITSKILLDEAFRKSMVEKIKKNNPTFEYINSKTNQPERASVYCYECNIVQTDPPYWDANGVRNTSTEKVNKKLCTTHALTDKLQFITGQDMFEINS